MKKQLQQGFTLIELMIVVAIIGILAAIAIPAYQNYTIRAQVSEGMSLAGGVQTAMSEYYTNTGTWPTNDQGGIPAATSITGNYVSKVTVSGGKISIAYGQTKANTAIQSDILTFSAIATSTSGSIQWICGSSTAGTNIPKQYLPSSCQG